MKCPNCGKEMLEYDPELEVIDQILTIGVAMSCFDCNIDIYWTQRWSLGELLEENYTIDED